MNSARTKAKKQAGANGHPAIVTYSDPGALAPQQDAATGMQNLATSAITEGPSSSPNFVDGGGPVIRNVQVQLIFWGQVWNNLANPTVEQVTQAVSSILAGTYMSALRQYRNIGSGRLIGQTIVSQASAHAAADPPNPFSAGNIVALLIDLIHAKTVAQPNPQVLYVVILPARVLSSQFNVVGEHFFFPLDGHNVHYAWVTNDGSLDTVTTRFSHELVEAVTDPEGTGIHGTLDNDKQSGLFEIVDACQGDTTVINGVAVQKYFSQKDGICVVGS